MNNILYPKKENQSMVVKFFYVLGKLIFLLSAWGLAIVVCLARTDRNDVRSFIAATARLFGRLRLGY